MSLNAQWPLLVCLKCTKSNQSIYSIRICFQKMALRDQASVFLPCFKSVPLSSTGVHEQEGKAFDRLHWQTCKITHLGHEN